MRNLNHVSKSPIGSLANWNDNDAIDNGTLLKYRSVVCSGVCTISYGFKSDSSLSGVGRREKDEHVIGMEWVWWKLVLGKVEQIAGVTKCPIECW